MTPDAIKAAIELASRRINSTDDVFRAPPGSNIDVLARALLAVSAENAALKRGTAHPLDHEGVDTSHEPEHCDLVRQLCDYVNHEAMDSGDPSGRLRDFTSAANKLLAERNAISAEATAMRALCEAVETHRISLAELRRCFGTPNTWAANAWLQRRIRMTVREFNELDRLISALDAYLIAKVRKTGEE